MTRLFFASPAALRAGGVAVLAVSLTIGLSACVPNNPGPDAADSTLIDVESTASECLISTDTVPSGTSVFTVSNSADQATEFYVFGEDGLRVVGEMENVAPGAPRTLTLVLPAGDYFTSCKPGLVGDFVGQKAFTVTDSGAPMPTGAAADGAAAAASSYIDYVKEQVSQLVPETESFLAAYRAGNDDTARSLYAPTRATYERIEPVAESFGQLDPSMDFREADVPAGEQWTGWHRIEKDLWPPSDYTALSPAERAVVADKLTADTKALYDAVHDEDYTLTIDLISNGAIALMDEVATAKITGEEEIWSHTDLSDFQANLEGARVAYEGLRDIVASNNPDLVADLDSEFDSLQKSLAAYGTIAGGFTPYDQLTTAEVRSLAAGVDSLGEPLSRLTAALVG